MQRKILIAEDHSIVVTGIKTICSSENIQDLDEVDTCKGLLKALRSGVYTHLIMDITLADGNALGILRQIFDNYSHLKVMIYSSQPSRHFGESLKRRYGFRFVSKAENASETVRQLLTFLRNTDYSSPQAGGNSANPFDGLAPMEKQILNYLLRAWPPKQIAEKLGTSSNSVRQQKLRIFEKTQTSDIEDLQSLAAYYKLRLPEL